MTNLLLSIDKTTDVFDTIKYEHEFIPKQKLIDNFLSIDFYKLIPFDIEEIFLFNHRNTEILTSDFINEFQKKDFKGMSKNVINSLSESVNVLNRNRFHLINTQQDFLNIIVGKNILLLEEYLDEFTTFILHRNYSQINEIIILDQNYKPVKRSPKEVLANVWNQISKKSENDRSKPFLFKYFQKYLIDFLPDPFEEEITKLLNTDIKKSTYYLWGKDEYLMNSLFAKVYNNFYNDKEYVVMSNSLEFRIPICENIFILIKGQIDADSLIQRLRARTYQNKRIYIFNYSRIEYQQFEEYDSLYIPRLSELGTIYHNIFTYHLIMANSNDFQTVKLLIDLEGYPDFFNNLKSFPEIKDIQRFVCSYSLNSANFRSVKQIKDKIIIEYRSRIDQAINRVYWKGKDIAIDFLDYKYVLKESAGLRLLIYLLDKPGRWDAEKFDLQIFDKLKSNKNPWDSFRRNYDNFLNELQEYERREFFQQHTLHKYLNENKIIDFKSKGDPKAISISDPSKWIIEI
ncbi:MAG: hypothetical protein H6609_17830 [Ignavibacteriales bacterium]|nr:hypothetical protein [Ignavibacteriales bacterium]